jgi:hypothetical protein
MGRSSTPPPADELKALEEAKVTMPGHPEACHAEMDDPELERVKVAHEVV